MQICGRLTLEIGGDHRESALPGPQGRLLLAYRVPHRHAPPTRDEAAFAIWDDNRRTGLGRLLGGTELATAERASRELVGLAPYRESAYRLLMRALAARGNGAEALRTYDGLVRRLRDGLGIGPSVATRDLHAELLSPAA